MIDLILGLSLMGFVIYKFPKITKKFFLCNFNMLITYPLVLLLTSIISSSFTLFVLFILLLVFCVSVLASEVLEPQGLEMYEYLIKLIKGENKSE